MAESRINRIKMKYNVNILTAVFGDMINTLTEGNIILQHRYFGYMVVHMYISAQAPATVDSLCVTYFNLWILYNAYFYVPLMVLHPESNADMYMLYAVNL